MKRKFQNKCAVVTLAIAMAATSMTGTVAFMQPTTAYAAPVKQAGGK